VPQSFEAIDDGLFMASSMKSTTAPSRVKRPVKSAFKISVLIPVYNGERYLAECLDSVLAQDFPDMEILLSDDYSGDGSKELMAKYSARDPRIRWWKNPRRVGLTANSNLCLRAATGEYIKFLHQDDKLLSPSALRKYAAALDAHPAAALASSRPHLTGKKTPLAPFRFRAGICDGRQMILDCFENNNNLIGPPSLAVFRRSSARRGFDERFGSGMDFEMWCHLLQQGDYVHLPEPLATWRIHASQQTAKSLEAGALDHDPLLLMETYYAMPWFQRTATHRLLFVQSQYLQKKFGSFADDLTRRMMARLPGHHYAWQWLRHKTSKPISKLGRKLARR
jgi:glycosyltransferase involved in cell wall biosynthesis